MNRAVDVAKYKMHCVCFSDLEIADSKWQLMPLPEVDTYLVAFSYKWHGQYVTVFLHGADEADIRNSCGSGLGS